MKNGNLDLDKWRKLHQLMGEIRKLEPWELLDEVDIFGVQHPTTAEIAFVCVMGQLGEHYAIAAYLGEEGLLGFQAMQEAGQKLSPEVLLEIPQLQASFEDSAILDPQDKKIIKALGLTYRGKKAWPLFRSYCPGFYPWYLQPEEQDFMILILDQTLQMTQRIAENPVLLEPAEDDQYLLRVPSREADTLSWRDQMMNITPSQPALLTPELNQETVQALRKLPVRALTVEVDLFSTGAVIGEKGERPYFAYLLLIADNRSGFLLGSEMLTPLPSLRAMLESVPQKVIEQLLKMEIRPQQLMVKAGVLFRLLSMVSEKVNLTVIPAKKLPAIEEAKKHMRKFFSSQSRS